MIEKTFADHFAADWIDSWNKHDLERILSHYIDDFEMSSPVIIKVAGEPSGTLKGKEAVGSYWAKALQLNPNLHFELLSIAAKQKFRVDRYFDAAVGVMEKNAEGKMAMTVVTLRPEVHFSGEHLPTREQIHQMHHEAHEQCFIANSVKTEVRCEPVL